MQTQLKLKKKKVIYLHVVPKHDEIVIQNVPSLV